MRKVLALLVLVCMTLSLSGCGMIVSRLLHKNTADKRPAIDVSDVEIKDDSSVDDENANEAPEYSDTDPQESFVEISEPESSEEESSLESSDEPEFDLMDYVDSYLKLDGLELYYVDDSVYETFPGRNKFEDNGWYNATIVIYASEDVEDFRLLSFDESVVLCVDKELMKMKSLKKGEMVIARLNINDISANRGFAYIVNSEEFYYYFVEDVSGVSAFPYSLNLFEPSAANADTNE